jgi:hypothetical protein
MLIVDTGVTDRHIVTGKLGHFGTKRQMLLGEWSIFH